MAGTKVQNLAVITPIGRESETLESFLVSMRGYLPRGAVHFLVTDPFTDKSSREIVKEFAREEQYQHVQLTESKGICNVYISGYQAALETEATHFLEIDAGFSHRPDEIPRFLEAAPNCDAVLGYRKTIPGISTFKSTVYRKTISRVGSGLSRATLSVPLKDLTTGFQLFNRSAISAILNSPLVSTGPFFQTEMKARAYWGGFEIVEVPISYSNPSHAITNQDLSDALHALNQIRKSKKK